MSTELSTNMASSPLSIIEKAIDKGIDADTMSKLVDLQERIQKGQAEAAFNQAMLDFQCECPLVIHDRSGDQDRYTYATLARIIQTIRPTLAKHGLTFSFDSTTTDLEMVISCTISHVQGHSRKNSVAMGICGTRAMSKPQMSASALTYGRRHAICAALGIVSADTDDDCTLGAGKERGVNPEPRQETRTAPRDKRDIDADVLDRFRSLGRRWKLIREQLGLSVTNDDYGQMICSVDEKIEPAHTLKPSLWTEATFTGVENEIRKLESQASL